MTATLVAVIQAEQTAQIQVLPPSTGSAIPVVKPEYLNRCLRDGVMPAICPEDKHSGPQYFTPKPPGGSQGAGSGTPKTEKQPIDLLT